MCPSKIKVTFTSEFTNNNSPTQVLKSNNSSSTSNVRPYTNAEVDESPVKKLDPKFISELEKHLGQKEASANTHNTWNHVESKNNTAEPPAGIPALVPPPQQPTRYWNYISDE